MDYNDNNFDGLKNIDDYLFSSGNKYPVEVPELEELIKVVASKANLDFSTTQQIIKYFFEEVRNIMLRGDIVLIRSFGSFFISSPKIRNKGKKIFPKFEMSFEMRKLLNGR